MSKLWICGECVIVSSPAHKKQWIGNGWNHPLLCSQKWRFSPHWCRSKQRWVCSATANRSGLQVRSHRGRWRFLDRAHRGCIAIDPSTHQSIFRDTQSNNREFYTILSTHGLICVSCRRNNKPLDFFARSNHLHVLGECDLKSRHVDWAFCRNMHNTSPMQERHCRGIWASSASLEQVSPQQLDVAR